jgi:hypothetical protein
MSVNDENVKHFFFKEIRMEYLARDKKKATEKAAAREQEIAIAEGRANKPRKKKAPKKKLSKLNFRTNDGPTWRTKPTLQRHVSSLQKFHDLVETGSKTTCVVNGISEVKHSIAVAVSRYNSQVQTSVGGRDKYPSLACSRKDEINMMEYIWESGGKKHSGFYFHLSFMMAWNFMMRTWIRSDNMRHLTMNDVVLLSDLYQTYPQRGGKRKHGEDKMNTGCRLFLNGTKKDQHKSDRGFVRNRDVLLCHVLMYGLWLYYRLHQEGRDQWHEELIVKGSMAQTNLAPWNQYSSMASVFLEIQVISGLPVRKKIPHLRYDGIVQAFLLGLAK